MQLIHPGGWRLLRLAHIDGDGVCHRLCLNHAWIGDYCSTELPDRLTALGLRSEDFGLADVVCCTMVDPLSHTVCLRSVEVVDGHGHLPLCSACRRTLAAMRGFPRLPATAAAAVAVSARKTMWLSVDDEQDRRDLSHLIRHPLAKILGWAEILHDDDTIGSAHARHLEVIYQSAKDLARLLDTAAVSHLSRISG